MTAPLRPAGTGVEDILERYAAQAPSSIAIIADGVEYSFAEVTAATDGLAAQLIPHTRVVIELSNTAASVMAIHAAWRANCSVISVSPMVPKR